MKKRRDKWGWWRPNAGRKKGPQVQTTKMILARLKQRRDAVANWRVTWTIRQTGKTYRVIGIELGIAEATAANHCYRYEEYLLNQRTKKAA